MRDAKFWLIYITLTSVAVIMIATASFGCSDKPRLSASRQRNLLMGNSHMFYQGTVPGLALAGHAYRNTTARSYALCSVYCLLSDECNSFNYCVGDKLCQLNSAVYSENNTLNESSGCIYFDESFHEALPCQVYATTEDVKFEKDMVMPVHLEFLVVSNEEVDVDFWDSENRNFEIELRPSGSVIDEQDDQETILSTQSEMKLLATRVVIDFNSTHITVGQKGKKESQFSLTYLPMTDTSSIVEIEGNGDATWTFYNPCEMRFV